MNLSQLVLRILGLAIKINALMAAGALTLSDVFLPLSDDMGLGNSSIQFCCAAKSLGVDFNKTLMIGRQWFYPDLDSLRQVFAVQGIDADAEALLDTEEYGEEFFALLGAKEVRSLDYSDYEGPSITHDMNSPISSDLRDKFSVVYDGGTLEHVFNVPQALKNCMEMVEVGGYFLQVSVANNLLGHGFWQFSPELLFRVFSPENGFEVVTVLLHENVAGGSWYLVRDPDEVRQRVELCNKTPTYILSVARKVAAVEVFSEPPLQSDYSFIWDSAAQEKANSDLQLKASDNTISHRENRNFNLKRLVPQSIKPALRSVGRRIPGQKCSDPFKKSYFRLLPLEKLLRGQLD